MQLEQSLTLERPGIFSELVKVQIVSLSCRKRVPNNVSTCVLRQPHLPLQNELDESQSELFQVVLRLRLAALRTCQQHFHFRTLRIILGASGRVPTFAFDLSLNLCCRTPCPNSLTNSLSSLASSRKSSFSLTLFPGLKCSSLSFA